MLLLCKVDSRLGRQLSVYLELLTAPKRQGRAIRCTAINTSDNNSKKTCLARQIVIVFFGVKTDALCIVASRRK